MTTVERKNRLMCNIGDKPL